MTTAQLAELASPKIKEFVQRDAAENGLDSCALQLRKRFLPDVPSREYDTHYDLVHLIVFGTDPNFRNFGK